MNTLFISFPPLPLSCLTLPTFYQFSFSFIIKIFNYSCYIYVCVCVNTYVNINKTCWVHLVLLIFVRFHAWWLEITRSRWGGGLLGIVPFSYDRGTIPMKSQQLDSLTRTQNLLITVLIPTSKGEITYALKTFWRTTKINKVRERNH